MVKIYVREDILSNAVESRCIYDFTWDGKVGEDWFMVAETHQVTGVIAQRAAVPTPEDSITPGRLASF